MADTDICNIALLKLGAEPITSLSDGTRNATLCARAYDICRKELLRAHPWNFAMTRATLAPLSTTPLFDFGFEFQLPIDCLKVWRLQDLYCEYRLEGRKILSNENTLKLFYIADVTNTDLFDVIFSETLALKLAYTLGYAITGSSTPVQLFTELYTQSFKHAKMMDAQENQAEFPDDSDWILGRHSNNTFNKGW